MTVYVTRIGAYNLHFIAFDSFIKKYLGSPTDIDVEKLKIEYEKLKDENLRLNKQVDELKKEVS